MPAPAVAAAAKVAAQWVVQKFAASNNKGTWIAVGIITPMLSLIMSVVLISSTLGYFMLGEEDLDCNLGDRTLSNEENAVVMTWNVCATCQDWNTRLDRIAADVQTVNPALLVLTADGGAERSKQTVTAMKAAGLTEATGVSGQGQHVFYDADRFDVVSKGNLDLAGPSGAAWARVSSKKTGTEVIVTGVQLSAGKTAAADSTRRSEMSRIVAAVDKANKAGRQILYVGDFNAALTVRNGAEPIDWLTARGYKDAGKAANNRTGADYATAHGNTAGRTKGTPTDHIFIPTEWTATTFKNHVLTNERRDLPSDHSAISATITLPGDTSGSTPSAEAAKDIPATALTAYRKAAGATNLDWAYLAAIGKIETNHGRFNGSKIDANGDTRPKIVNSIGASGPMQFMPATWKDFGQDGNLDGKSDVQNIFDAALAAGRKLSAQGAPSDWDAALFAYNRSREYVKTVKAQAVKYGAAPLATGGSPGMSATTLAAMPALKTEVPHSDQPTGTSADWVRPVTGGTITARFGQPGSMWSSGYHTGTDFAVPTGTPVFAAQAGSVSVSHPGWAGNLVTVSHGVLDGKKVETTYAHLSRVVVSSGMVQAGDLIAYSGALGNVSGPHLHFEVHLNGKGVNPETYLATAGSPVFTGDPTSGDCGELTIVGDESGNLGWGGYANGRIPASAMCSIVSMRNGLLRCDAARSLNLLDGRFKAKYGRHIPVVTAYRDYAAQAACVASGRSGECEKPGNSAYGWGLVVALEETFGTRNGEFKWLRKEARAVGWDWAQDRRWHFKG